MPGILLIGGAMAENKEGVIRVTVALLFWWRRWPMSEQLSTQAIEFSNLVRTAEENKTV